MNSLRDLIIKLESNKMSHIKWAVIGYDILAAAVITALIL